MKSLLKSFFLCLVIALMPMNNAHAVMAVTTASHSADSAQVIHFLLHHSTADIEKTLHRKLSWRERIAVKVLQWKLGKTAQFNPMPNYRVSDTTPSVNCSKIVMKNGKTIKADVIQIAATEVKYRRCGVPSDPEMIESKANIDSVVASDGTNLYKNDGKIPPGPLTNNGDLPIEKLAISAASYGAGAWILGLLVSSVGSSLLAIMSILCAIGAVVYGIMSLKKINKEPNKYRGKGLAIGGIILGGLFCFLFIIGLIAVLGA